MKTKPAILLLSVLAAAVLLVLPCEAGAAWARRYDTRSPAMATRLAALPKGEIAVVTQSVVFTVVEDGTVKAARGWPGAISFSGAGPAGLYVGGIVSPLPGQGRPFLALARLDASLEVGWSRTYVTPPDAHYLIWSVDGAPDGDVVAAGEVSSAAVLFRFDSQGRPRWGLILNLSGTESLSAVRSTADGGCVAAGRNSGGAWLVKIARDGTVEWQKTFTGSRRFEAVAVAKDGTIIAAGSSFAHPFVASVSAKGEPRWQRVGTSESRVNALTVDADGSILALADTRGRESGPVLLRLDANGALLWSRRFGRALTPSVLLPPNVLTTAGGRVVIAPPLPENDRSQKFVLYAIDAATGTTPCASIEDAKEVLEKAAVPVETADLEQRSVQLQVEEERVAPVPASVTTAPWQCETGAPASPEAPVTSPFRGAAEGNARRESFARLLEQRDIAGLEAAAATVRKQTAWPSPLLSPLMDFHLGVAVAEIDEASRLETLRAWVRQHADSPTASVALASALYEAAWAKRGGGYSSTVTDRGARGYDTLLAEAERALQAAGDAADHDPMAWTLRISIGHETGRGDVRELARRASKFSSDERIYSTAANYLYPRWGGSTAEFRAFAEKAAEWTRRTHGDGMYARLAYVAWYGRGRDAEYEEFGFDWERTQRGFRDLVKMKPAWLPTWHNWTRLACKLQKRADARELFSRPELNWYESAESVWQSRAEYDAARKWALGRPLEGFVEGAQRPVAPAAKGGAVNAAPAGRTGASFIRTPEARWPQIVMESDLVLPSATHRQLAFLVQRAGGIVAVSSVPFPSEPPQGNLVRDTFRKMQKWTMWSPQKPKGVLEAISCETMNPVNFQGVLAMAVKPFAGAPPVHALTMRGEQREPSFTSPHFVVGCRRVQSACEQVVYEGTIGGSSSHSLRLRLQDKVEDPDTLRGAPVLDEDGHVIAVVVGPASTTAPETYLDAQPVSLAFDE